MCEVFQGDYKARGNGKNINFSDVLALATLKSVVKCSGWTCAPYAGGLWAYLTRSSSETTGRAFCVLRLVLAKHLLQIGMADGKIPRHGLAIADVKAASIGVFDVEARGTDLKESYFVLV